MVLGVFGATMFYGDSVITPAISVLGAIEGLEVATPGLEKYVVPLTIVVVRGPLLLVPTFAGDKLSFFTTGLATALLLLSLGPYPQFDEPVAETEASPFKGGQPAAALP